MAGRVSRGAADRDDGYDGELHPGVVIGVREAVQPHLRGHPATVTSGGGRRAHSALVHPG
ncbi:hypothetical protein OG936_32920 [Streptomyces sp. NBC_00846]|uniref:hypothetical protein n=1 Tax=Streptomyces sp. NBC_00846 TaxID=2975849 RepID=UPI003867B216|nr:hypothetical protein OG936_32920 [Streptomyces sp. NBC_00846]